MPPKVKRPGPGRPIGSKNKRKISKVLKKAINISEEPKIKTENVNVAENSLSGDVSILSKEEFYNKKAIYNCKKCPNKNFKFLNHYEEHLLMEHSTTPGSIACGQCHVVCPNQKTLDAHITKIHERDVFTCEYCGQAFVRQAHVLRHMAQKGCDGSQVALHPCEICGAKFTRKDNLIVHLRQMHLKRAYFRCKYTKCNFTSKNFTKLIRHWHALHAAVPNRFECDMCGKSTMSRAAMAKHLEIHGERKYACDVCKYTTFTIEVMRRHVLTHVEVKPYKCHICNTSFIQRQQLERHLERHMLNKCSICNKQFEDKPSLIIHYRRHGGIAKLQCVFKECSYYDKEFESEQAMMDHLKYHFDTDKTYPCEVCNKQFRSDINMRRHLSTHTLDRPRRCMYCVSARAYVRGQQLVRHVRKFHKDVFASHLAHVRQVMKTSAHNSKDRVTSSELDSILDLLDAESDRILDGYINAGVLYGGMQTASYDTVPVEHEPANKEAEEEDAPLMSEEVLADNLSKLLAHLIDEETLQCLGYPEEPVDVILEKVIEQCGVKPASRDKWSRVQLLRENAKLLFLYVVDDKSVSRMLGSHTIDQIVKHLLTQADDSEDTDDSDCKPILENEIEDEEEIIE